MPKTLNSLMKHLRSNGISIGGSTQKRKLKNIGYYHGYKGYRFAGSSSNKLPISDFAQITALYDLDMQLKTLFYPRIMAIETALKNYTLEAVIKDSGSKYFEAIWKSSLTDYRDQKNPRLYKQAWARRQQLRKAIDDLVYFNHDKRYVIGHFRDADKDIPIWALFEVMTLGNFGAFYKCLNRRVRDVIVADLHMPTNLTSSTLLADIIFVLKDLRNAIAHNMVVLDVRFKSGSINTGITQLLKQETHVGGVDFNDITDYVILLVYLMRCLGFTKTECRQLLSGFVSILERYRADLPFDIYSKVIKTNARSKVIAAQKYVSAS